MKRSIQTNFISHLFIHLFIFSISRLYGDGHQLHKLGCSMHMVLLGEFSGGCDVQTRGPREPVFAHFF